MKLAVLCPGPSLPRFWGVDRKKPGWDLVIAVNTAGWIYECDWLVYADAKIADAIRNQEADPPRIGYVTHPRTPLPTEGRRVPLPLRNERCRYGAFLPRGEDTISCCYTFPNALRYAQSLLPPDASQIHVYGFDCAPVPNGVCLEAGNHHLARWVSELPWIKHCWSGRVYLHSDLPQPVRRWITVPDASAVEYADCIECLCVRCAGVEVAV